MAHASEAAVAFTVERDALAGILATAVKVIERRNTIPILSNILLRAAGTTLRVTATDFDIEVTSAIPAEIEAAGDLTLYAAPVADILRRIPAGARITLTQAAVGGQATLRSGKTRLTLHTLPVDTFPTLMDSTGSNHRVQIAGSMLAHMLGQVEFAISSEETRYYLNGTYLHVADTEDGLRLRGVATDGHRLARADVVAEGLSSAMPGVIVPRKTAGELRRLAEAAGDAPVSIEVTERQIQATIGNTVLTSKVIDGSFPDYARVIPTGNDRLMKVGTVELAAAVGRVTVVSDGKARAVHLALDGQTLGLTTNSDDHGSCSEEVEVDHDGGPFEIGFNGRYLGEILGQLGDVTLFKFGGAGSPALLMSREGADALFVLMPMRV